MLAVRREATVPSRPAGWVLRDGEERRLRRLAIANVPDDTRDRREKEDKEEPSHEGYRESQVVHVTGALGVTDGRGVE